MIILQTKQKKNYKIGKVYNLFKTKKYPILSYSYNDVMS